jgi:hypothetical protein
MTFTPHKTGWMLYHVGTGFGVSMFAEKPQYVSAGYACVEVDPSTARCGMVLDGAAWREANQADTGTFSKAMEVERNPAPFSFVVAVGDLPAALDMSMDFSTDNPQWAFGPRESLYPDRLSASSLEPATHLLCWSPNMAAECETAMMSYRASNPNGAQKHGPVASWEWTRHPAGTTREQFLAATGLKRIPRTGG